jgi:hypothetical protein
MRIVTFFEFIELSTNSHGACRGLGGKNIHQCYLDIPRCSSKQYQGNNTLGEGSLKSRKYRLILSNPKAIGGIRQRQAWTGTINKTLQ